MSQFPDPVPTGPQSPQYPPPPEPAPWPGPAQAQEMPQAQGFGPPPGIPPQAGPVQAMAPGYGFGAAAGMAAPAGMFLDQQSGLMLPQGTQLASSGRRIGAYFLAIPLAIVTLGIGYIIWGLLIWGRGQTPALQVLGMRCFQPDAGRVPGFWRMALREIVGRIVEGLLFVTELVSFIFMLTRNDRRTLHDLVAGTVVLHDPDKVLASR